MEEIEIRHSTTHPNYLHSNSTSHKLPFSAIAELVDNSVDSQATNMWIDVAFPNSPTNYTALTFMDDGCGMDLVHLHKMMSFGHCEKVDTAERKVIGRYGNGFKSGSMRLGKDAIVFTKTHSTWSVGLLSQTFLQATNSQEVLVPMASWKSSTMEYDLNPKSMDRDLEIIYKYSPFETFEQVISQFNEISSTQGTRIIVFNLRCAPGNQSSSDSTQKINSSGSSNSSSSSNSNPNLLLNNRGRERRTSSNGFQGGGRENNNNNNRNRNNNNNNNSNNNNKDEEDTEKVVPPGHSLDFTFDSSYDICLLENANSSSLPGNINAKVKKGSNPEGGIKSICSLRSYLSILYLNPKMHIYIRGAKIRANRLPFTLWKMKKYIYSPKEASMNLYYGFQLHNFRNDYGMMIYHKGRLIKWLYKVGVQLSPDSRGLGVVGLIDAPPEFLTPTHNKQDFVEDKHWRLLNSKLTDNLKEYWTSLELEGKLEEWWGRLKIASEKSKRNFVQCDKCFKWRAVPEIPSAYPDTWECSMNDNLEENDCSIPESEPIIVKSTKKRKTRNEMQEKLEENLQKIDNKKKNFQEKLMNIVVGRLQEETPFSEVKCRLAAMYNNINFDLAKKWLYINEELLDSFEDEDLTGGLADDIVFHSLNETRPSRSKKQNDYSLAVATPPSKRRRGSSSATPVSEPLSSPKGKSPTSSKGKSPAKGKKPAQKTRAEKSKKSPKPLPRRKASFTREEAAGSSSSSSTTSDPLSPISPPPLHDDDTPFNSRYPKRTSRNSSNANFNSIDNNNNNRGTRTPSRSTEESRLLTNRSTREARASPGRPLTRRLDTLSKELSSLRFTHDNEHTSCEHCASLCDKLKAVFNNVGKNISCDELFSVDDSKLQEALDFTRNLVTRAQLAEERIHSLEEELSRLKKGKDVTTNNEEEEEEEKEEEEEEEEEALIQKRRGSIKMLHKPSNARSYMTSTTSTTITRSQQTSSLDNGNSTWTKESDFIIDVTDD